LAIGTVTVAWPPLRKMKVTVTVFPTLTFSWSPTSVIETLPMVGLAGDEVVVGVDEDVDEPVDEDVELPVELPVVLDEELLLPVDDVDDPVELGPDVVVGVDDGAGAVPSRVSVWPASRVLSPVMVTRPQLLMASTSSSSWRPPLMITPRSGTDAPAG